MKVVATKKGFFGAYREVGDVFEVPDDTFKVSQERKPSWFEPIEKVKAPAKAETAAKAEGEPEVKGNGNKGKVRAEPADANADAGETLV